jgi:ATP-dependent Clp protease protease subunit
MAHTHYKRGILLSFFLASTAPSLTAKALVPDTKKTKTLVAQKKEQLPKKPKQPKKAPPEESKDNNQRALEAANALNRALLEQKLSSLVAQIEQLRLEKEHQRLLSEIEETKTRKEHEASIRALQMQKEKLMAELELAQVAFNKQIAAESIKIATLDREALLQKSQAQVLQETKNRLQAEIAQLQTKVERDKHLVPQPVYLKNPLRKADNVLVLSDRCIELNTEIMPWSANYVIDQIQYFNNKDTTYPIFLVIDICPGGSVLAGWDILQAMKHSKAPVYVVVKKYAASMAAILTTLAVKSYAYPNAVILHHQPTSSGWCAQNLREREEAYKRLAETWQRLGGAVAKKMGISLKAFDKKLYEKSMYGNWKAYGNQAQKVKWVDVVINGIDDTALSSLPDSDNYTWEKYRKKVYGLQPGQTASMEEEQYYALAPHDYNYSYHPAQKAPIKAQQGTR